MPRLPLPSGPGVDPGAYVETTTAELAAEAAAYDRWRALLESLIERLDLR